MKVQMYDVNTGAQRGEINIPEDVGYMAIRVAAWMKENAVDCFQDLQLRERTPAASSPRKR